MVCCWGFFHLWGTETKLKLQEKKRNAKLGITEKSAGRISCRLFLPSGGQWVPVTCISLVGREGGAAAEGSVALTKLPGRITTGTVDEEHTHTHHLKGENYVLFSRYTQDISPGFSLSDISEKVFQRGKGRARIYSFCKKKKQKYQEFEHEKTDISR